MNKRLKLYEETLILSISKKDKTKLKKISFKNSKTMSDFVRSLIKLAILTEETIKTKNEEDRTNFEIEKLLLLLGRDK